jgi:CubicO group peptidase (beta-lactamase class C family)
LAPTTLGRGNARWPTGRQRRRSLASRVLRVHGQEPTTAPRPAACPGALFLVLLSTLPLGAGCSDAYVSDGSVATGEVRAKQVTPEAVGDGWTTAAPAELGLSAEPLERMAAAIRGGEYPNVHVVLVAQNGRLVFEEYFEGQDTRYRLGERDSVTLVFDRDTLHDVRSVTKSLTSALVGISLDDAAISSVDVPVSDFFPEHRSLASIRTGRLTLHHALTMTGGLDWNEADVPYTDPANDGERMEASTDPARMLLERRLVSDPGSTWYYNSGLPVLLGIVVSRATGQSFGAYAQEKLFGPLEFGPLEWRGPMAWADVPELTWNENRVGSAAVDPAGALWLRPRDLLKFGSLYLNGGRWRGGAVLSPDWVDRSLEPVVWRDAPIEHGEGVSSHGGYGYLWWYDRYTLPYGELTVHSADGNGGQRLWVVPELDLVALHLTGNYNLPWATYHAERLLLERIVPWALGTEMEYRHEVGRPSRALQPEELDMVELTATERARYVGAYEEPGDRLEVRDEDGTLWLVLPGAGSVELFPLGDHTFAMGRRDAGGAPARLFWPDERAVFIVDSEGEVLRYEYRDVRDDTVWGTGERVR